MEKENKIAVLDTAKNEFSLIMNETTSLDIVNNVGGAFDAAIIINKLERVLSEDVMKAVFMPLMNKKIGFLTDHDPARRRKDGTYSTPYSVDIVRTSIIDAASIGLMPTGNQFNIIAERMYPTKEGYTALLKRLSQTMKLKYVFQFDNEKPVVNNTNNPYVSIPTVIYYELNGEKQKPFMYTASVKQDSFSSDDQRRGKAERKAKKAFYEFLTGNDFGDADADTIDVPYTEVRKTPQEAAKDAITRLRERKELEENARSGQSNTAAPTPRSNGAVSGQLDLNNMTDSQIDAMLEGK
jgi:hypothetical protein